MSPWEGVLLGFVLGAIVNEVLHEIRNAPIGWEDEDGFHLVERRAERTALQKRADADDPDVIPLHEYAEHNHHRRGA